MSNRLILKELSRYKVGTYADIIYRNALLYSDDMAFKYGSETLTFSEFNSRVNNLIRALQGMCSVFCHGIACSTLRSMGLL